MWHKVSPLAFRVPYIKTWKSTWYDNKKSYKDSLEMDLKVRQLLNTELKGIPLWDILINKDQESIQVVVYTAKPVLVLWNKEKIENLLTRKLWKKISLEVREVKKPDINAKIVWFNIANQIEKRMPYKRAIKQAIAKAMEKGARWIKVKVGWRLNWAEIARKEMFKDGNIPTQTIRADIDYVSTRAETVYWTIGLKVWIYKWDIFKK